MSLVSDSPADNQRGADPPDSAPAAKSKKNWAPTEDAFNRLLALISSDREEAGREYEKLRTKLIRFFEWRGCGPADILADFTFDRVMRKIDEGEQITNLRSYSYTVANYIFHENNDPHRLTELDEGLSVAADPPDPDSEDDSRLSDCCAKCLDKLPPQNRELIMTYYQEDKGKKIELRRQLAEELGVPMNALRIRAHRIRKTLEECIQNCLATTH
jgi:RNA polymerase sigma factor (sigma-70 family)